MGTSNAPPTGFLTRSRAGPRPRVGASRPGGSTLFLQIIMCICAIAFWNAGLGEEITGIVEELERELTRISSV